MTPRVSVVVPSYNNARFIEATMDSILAQTFEDFELVVADHSSSEERAGGGTPGGPTPSTRPPTSGS